MTQERHDPWALLREAHSFVDPYEGDLFERIHAALAEHDAVPPSEETVEFVWEWHTFNNPNRFEALLTGGARVGVQKANINGVLGWMWDVEHHPTGFAATLDEAKSAAIAAARRMK